MQSDEPKAGVDPQANERKAMTAEEERSARRARAINSGVSIMGQPRVKNQELAAKQARLLALLKAETPPQGPQESRPWSMARRLF